MESKEEVKSFEVAKGPSRDALFEIVKHVYDKRPKKYDFDIRFDGEKALNVHEIRLTGIEHLGNAGFVFVVRGYCKMTFSPYTDVPSHLHEKRFEMEYDAKNHKGTIKFKTPNTTYVFQ